MWAHESPSVLTSFASVPAALDAADLLVAGAYGHMELMEWLFGGVRHNLLEVADLPLLLAH